LRPQPTKQLDNISATCVHAVPSCSALFGSMTANHTRWLLAGILSQRHHPLVCESHCCTDSVIAADMGSVTIVSRRCTPLAAPRLTHCSWPSHSTGSSRCMLQYLGPVCYPK
jgi:hypothetical protein